MFSCISAVIPIPVSRTPQNGLIGLSNERERDLTAGFGVLHSVVQQVRDYLLESRRIAFDVQWFGRNGRREWMRENIKQREGCFDGVLYDQVQVNEFFAQLYGTAGDS